MREENRDPSPPNRGLTVMRYAALFVALLGLYPLQRVLTLKRRFEKRMEAAPSAHPG